VGWRPFGHAASLRDYGVTFVAEFATLAAGLLVLRLAAWRWGPTGFGEYVLVRRTLSLLQLPILCNMGTAISRYVAMSGAGGGGARSSRQTYLVGATAVAASATLVASLLLIAAAKPGAALLFGSPRYAPLMRVVAFALPGIILHGVAYGYFRGRLQMLAANALQIVNLGVVPVAVFAIPRLSVLQTVTLLAMGWNLVTLAALLPLLWAAAQEGQAGLAAAVRELLRYGLPRVPGEFALAALFSLPTTVAAHFGGVEQAGFIGLGVSLLSLVGSMFSPLGQIVLPSASAMAARGEIAALGKGVWRLWLASVAAAGVMVVILGVGARPLITLYVGAAFLPAVPMVRLLLLAGIPHVTYVVLRNVLDALDTRPRNAKNLILALALFGAIALAVGRSAAVAGALVAAIALLGLLSLRDARSLLSGGA
jgi:O-antigen/teichoic acid export membrane protein